MSVDWTEAEMLDIRIDMLAEDLCMRTFNKAMQLYGSSPELREELKSFTWVTMGDDHVCALCSDHEGDSWKPGQLMPMMPAHVGCRCSLDVELVPP